MREIVAFLKPCISLYFNMICYYSFPVSQYNVGMRQDPRYWKVVTRLQQKQEQGMWNVTCDELFHLKTSPRLTTGIQN